MAMAKYSSRQEYLQELRKLYVQARKDRDRKRMTSLLDDAERITGLHRKYIITAMRRFSPTAATIKQKRSTVLGSNGINTKLDSRGRKPIYGTPEFHRALLVCWRATGEVCAENLQPYLQELVPKLISCRELAISSETKYLLLSASISTVARHLRREKRRSLVPLGTTKPGTFLKRQIPIRQGRWNETEPGWLEGDTVAHCADDPSGQFIYSYNFVDIATGWCEVVPVMGKGERATVSSLELVQKRFPFAIRGLDSDNGGEYINHHLWRYCRRRAIEFTRSRPYEKNDNAHVEQKNYTAIRQMVGYYRYDNTEQLALMERLYSESLRLLRNYCIPTRKRKSCEYDPLTGKTRKHYYESKTPFQRVMQHPSVPTHTKNLLQSEYNKLNPVTLQAEVRALVEELRRMV